jgi:hypothetical protein
MKLPAASILARYAAIARADKAALAVLRDRGEPFTVPAFCSALSGILAREAANQPGEWEAPWEPEDYAR